MRDRFEFIAWNDWRWPHDTTWLVVEVVSAYDEVRIDLGIAGVGVGVRVLRRVED